MFVEDPPCDQLHARLPVGQCRGRDATLHTGDRGHRDVVDRLEPSVNRRLQPLRIGVKTDASSSVEITMAASERSPVICTKTFWTSETAAAYVPASSAVSSR